jgi:hypothetical protein
MTHEQELCEIQTAMKEAKGRLDFEQYGDFLLLIREAPTLTTDRWG